MFAGKRVGSGRGTGPSGARRQASCLSLPGGASPGGSRPPIWCRSCREVGGGVGASPHRLAINHSYVAREQGVGRGQGAAAATHTGQGREARVRCSCKLSPKCLQAKANQGAVRERTWPNPAPVAITLLSGQAHTHAPRYKNTPGHVPHAELGAQRGHTYTWNHKHACTHQTYRCRMRMHTCACAHAHTARQLCAHSYSFRPRDAKI